MNAIVRSKAFKSGNSVAVRLPRSFGVEAGTSLVLERNGSRIVIAPAEDPDVVRRDLQATLDAISAMWDRHGGPPTTPMERDPDIFPDRPGLYS